MSSNKISNSWNKRNADALIKRLSEEDKASLYKSAEVLNKYLLEKEAALTAEANDPQTNKAAEAIDDRDEEVDSEDDDKSYSFKKLLRLNKQYRNRQNREENNKFYRQLLIPMSDIKKWFKQEHNILDKFLSNPKNTVCLCERISDCNTVLRKFRFEQRYSLLPRKCSWCASASDDNSCDTSSDSDSEKPEKPNRVFVFSPAYVECQGEPYSDDACCSSYLPCECCDRGYEETHY
jgi:hypothetical protein